MISQSINNLDELLELLIKDKSGYYIEQKSISSKEEIDGHTIYSKFKFFKSKITPILIEQHLRKDINLAISLKDSNAIVYEYSGKYKDAFTTLLKHYFEEENIRDIYIIDNNNQKIILYIPLTIEEKRVISDITKNIEKKLENKIPKEWRVLPNILRPEIGNLLILPREFIEWD